MKISKAKLLIGTSLLLGAVTVTTANVSADEIKAATGLDTGSNVVTDISTEDTEGNVESGDDKKLETENSSNIESKNETPAVVENSTSGSEKSQVAGDESNQAVVEKSTSGSGKSQVTGDESNQAVVEKSALDSEKSQVAGGKSNNEENSKSMTPETTSYTDDKNTTEDKGVVSSQDDTETKTFRRVKRDLTDMSASQSTGNSEDSQTTSGDKNTDQSFFMYLVSEKKDYSLGLSQDNPYIIEPTANKVNTMELNLTMNSKTSDRVYKAGEMEVKVPKYIFEGWDGSKDLSYYYDKDDYLRKINQYSFDLPEGYEDPNYAFRIDTEGDYINIKNYKEFKGSTFNVSIKYRFIPSLTKSNRSGEVIYNPTIKFITKKDGVLENSKDTTLYIGLKTDNDKLTASTDINGYESNDNDVYERWQNAWGEKIADDDKYSYVIWNLDIDRGGLNKPGEESKKVNTMPYKYSIYDESDQGEVIGFKKLYKTGGIEDSVNSKSEVYYGYNYFKDYGQTSSAGIMKQKVDTFNKEVPLVKDREGQGSFLTKELIDQKNYGDKIFREINRLDVSLSREAEKETEMYDLTNRQRFRMMILKKYDKTTFKKIMDKQEKLHAKFRIDVVSQDDERYTVYAENERQYKPKYVGLGDIHKKDVVDAYSSNSSPLRIAGGLDMLDGTLPHKVITENIEGKNHYYVLQVDGTKRELTESEKKEYDDIKITYYDMYGLQTDSHVVNTGNTEQTTTITEGDYYYQTIYKDYDRSRDDELYYDRARMMSAEAFLKGYDKVNGDTKVINGGTSNGKPVEYKAIEPAKKLDESDYRYRSLYITVSEKDGIVHEDGSGEVDLEENKNYSDYKPIEIYIRTEGSKTFEKFGEVKRTGAEKYEFEAVGKYKEYTNDNVRYTADTRSRPEGRVVGDRDDYQIKFPDRVVGLQYKHISSHALSSITAKTTIALRPTENLKNISNTAKQEKKGVFVYTNASQETSKGKKVSSDYVGDSSFYLDSVSYGSYTRVGANGRYNQDKSAIHDDSENHIESMEIFHNVSNSFNFSPDLRFSDQRGKDIQEILRKKIHINNGTIHVLLPIGTGVSSDTVQVYQGLRVNQELPKSSDEYVSGITYEKLQELNDDEIKEALRKNGYTDVGEQKLRDEFYKKFDSATVYKNRVKKNKSMQVSSDHYNVTLTENWNNTGRSLLEVKLKDIPPRNEDLRNDDDIFNAHNVYLRYILEKDYSMINIYGGNSTIETVFTKEGDSYKFRSQNKGDLNGNPLQSLVEDKEFVYFKNSVDFIPKSVSQTGITQKTMVKENKNSSFVNGEITKADGSYGYDVQYGVDNDEEARGIVFYSKLEDDYTGEGGINAPEWKGKFVSINTKDLGILENENDDLKSDQEGNEEDKKVDYKIYYGYDKPKELSNSDTAEANLDMNSAVERFTNDASKNFDWYTEKQSGKDVKAVILDLRKDKKGRSFVLRNNVEKKKVNIVKFRIEMQAPNDLDLNGKKSNNQTHVSREQGKLGRTSDIDIDSKSISVGSRSDVTYRKSTGDYNMKYTVYGDSTYGKPIDTVPESKEGFSDSENVRIAESLSYNPEQKSYAKKLSDESNGVGDRGTWTFSGWYYDDNKDKDGTKQANDGALFGKEGLVDKLNWNDYSKISDVEKSDKTIKIYGKWTFTPDEKYGLIYHEQIVGDFAPADNEKVKPGDRSLEQKNYDDADFSVENKGETVSDVDGVKDGVNYKGDWKFEGWYTDNKDYKNKLNTNAINWNTFNGDKIEKNMNLYGKWTFTPMYETVYRITSENGKFPDGFEDKVGKTASLSDVDSNNSGGILILGNDTRFEESKIETLGGTKDIESLFKETSINGETVKVYNVDKVITDSNSLDKSKMSYITVQEGDKKVRQYGYWYLDQNSKDAWNKIQKDDGKYLKEFTVDGKKYKFVEFDKNIKFKPYYSVRYKINGDKVYGFPTNIKGLDTFNDSSKNKESTYDYKNYDIADNVSKYKVEKSLSTEDTEVTKDGITTIGRWSFSGLKNNIDEEKVEYDSVGKGESEKSYVIEGNWTFAPMYQVSYKLNVEGGYDNPVSSKIKDYESKLNDEAKSLGDTFTKKALPDVSSITTATINGETKRGSWSITGWKFNGNEFTGEKMPNSIDNFEKVSIGEKQYKRLPLVATLTFKELEKYGIDYNVKVVGNYKPVDGDLNKVEELSYNKVISSGRKDGSDGITLNNNEYYHDDNIELSAAPPVNSNIKAEDSEDIIYHGDWVFSGWYYDDKYENKVDGNVLNWDGYSEKIGSINTGKDESQKINTSDKKIKLYGKWEYTPKYEKIYRISSTDVNLPVNLAEKLGGNKYKSSEKEILMNYNKDLHSLEEINSKSINDVASGNVNSLFEDYNGEKVYKFNKNGETILDNSQIAGDKLDSITVDENGQKVRKYGYWYLDNDTKENWKNLKDGKVLGENTFTEGNLTVLEVGNHKYKFAEFGKELKFKPFFSVEYRISGDEKYGLPTYNNAKETGFNNDSSEYNYKNVNPVDKVGEYTLKAVPATSESEYRYNDGSKDIYVHGTWKFSNWNINNLNGAVPERVEVAGTDEKEDKYVINGSWTFTPEYETIYRISSSEGINLPGDLKNKLNEYTRSLKDDEILLTDKSGLHRIDAINSEGITNSDFNNSINNLFGDYNGEKVYSFNEKGEKILENSQINRDKLDSVVVNENGQKVRKYGYWYLDNDTKENWKKKTEKFTDDNLTVLEKEQKNYKFAEFDKKLKFKEYYSVEYNITGDKTYGLPEYKNSGKFNGTSKYVDKNANPIDNKSYTLTSAPTTESTEYRGSDGVSILGDWKFTGWTGNGLNVSKGEVTIPSLETLETSETTGEGAKIYEKKYVLNGSWTFTPKYEAVYRITGENNILPPNLSSVNDYGTRVTSGLDGKLFGDSNETYKFEDIDSATGNSSITDTVNGLFGDYNGEKVYKFNKDGINILENSKNPNDKLNKDILDSIEVDEDGKTVKKYGYWYLDDKTKDSWDKQKSKAKFDEDDFRKLSVGDKKYKFVEFDKNLKFKEYVSVSYEIKGDQKYGLPTYTGETGHFSKENSTYIDKNVNRFDDKNYNVLNGPQTGDTEASYTENEKLIHVLGEWTFSGWKHTSDVAGKEAENKEGSIDISDLNMVNISNTDQKPVYEKRYNLVGTWTFTPKYEAVYEVKTDNGAKLPDAIKQVLEGNNSSGVVSSNIAGSNTAYTPDKIDGAKAEESINEKINNLFKPANSPDGKEIYILDPDKNNSIVNSDKTINTGNLETAEVKNNDGTTTVKHGYWYFEGNDTNSWDKKTKGENDLTVLETNKNNGNKNYKFMKFDKVLKFREYVSVEYRAKGDSIYGMPESYSNSDENVFEDKYLKVGDDKTNALDKYVKALDEDKKYIPKIKPKTIITEVTLKDSEGNNILDNTGKEITVLGSWEFTPWENDGNVLGAEVDINDNLENVGIGDSKVEKRYVVNGTWKFTPKSQVYYKVVEDEKYALPDMSSTDNDNQNLTIEKVIEKLGSQGSKDVVKDGSDASNTTDVSYLDPKLEDAKYEIEKDKNNSVDLRAAISSNKNFTLKNVELENVGKIREILKNVHKAKLKGENGREVSGKWYISEWRVDLPEELKAKLKDVKTEEEFNKIFKDMQDSAYQLAESTDIANNSANNEESTVDASKANGLEDVNVENAGIMRMFARMFNIFAAMPEEDTGSNAAEASTTPENAEGSGITLKASLKPITIDGKTYLRLPVYAQLKFIPDPVVHSSGGSSSIGSSVEENQEKPQNTENKTEETDKVTEGKTEDGKTTETSNKDKQSTGKENTTSNKDSEKSEVNHIDSTKVGYKNSSTKLYNKKLYKEDNTNRLPKTGTVENRTVTTVIGSLFTLTGIAALRRRKKEKK